MIIKLNKNTSLYELLDYYLKHYTTQKHIFRIKDQKAFYNNLKQYMEIYSMGDK